MLEPRRGSCSSSEAAHRTAPGGDPMDVLAGSAMTAAVGPVVDGELLPHGTVDALAAGIGADKPLVLGTVDDEFSMILDGAKGKLRWVPPGSCSGRSDRWSRAHGLPRGERRRAASAAPRQWSAGTSPTGCSDPRPARRRGPRRRPDLAYRFSWRHRGSAAPRTASMCRSSSTASTPTTSTRSPARRRRTCSPTRCTVTPSHSCGTAIPAGRGSRMPRATPGSTMCSSTVAADGYASVRPLLAD